MTKGQANASAEGRHIGPWFLLQYRHMALM